MTYRLWRNLGRTIIFDVRQVPGLANLRKGNPKGQPCEGYISCKIIGKIQFLSRNQVQSVKKPSQG
jgi:hypothetical protein